MDENTCSRDEATHMAETILNMYREQLLTKNETNSAIQKIPYYADILSE